MEREDEHGVEPPPDESSGLMRDAVTRWDGTLDKTLRAALIPYGYTVTIWATGAYLVRDQQIPGITAVNALLFMLGALLAFALLVTRSQRRISAATASSAEPVPIHPDSSHPILLAGLHILAAGIAFGGGVLVKAVFGVGAISWFFGPFVVTILYLSLSSLELAAAIEWHRRRTPVQEGERPPRIAGVPRARRGATIAYSGRTEYGVEEQSAPRGGRGRPS